MTIIEIHKFEKFHPQLVGLYKEISKLAKDTPNDSIDEFKLSFINEVLIEANNILGKEYMPFKLFRHFDQDNFPSYSDILFMLSQYLACFETLRSYNVYFNNDYNHWYWAENCHKQHVITSVPKKALGK